MRSEKSNFVVDKMDDYANKKIILERFITNNEELEELESKINEFNPFKILKIQDFEIRHSNVLAWLFYPNENHGFGDYILKKFILKLFEQNELIILILKLEHRKNIYD